MPAAQRDYYEVLGVVRDADQKAIRDAFRELALRYHPDRNKEPEAEERFKEIAQAYAVLSDPHKRAEYDRAGLAGIAGFSPEDLFGGVEFDDIFGGLGLGIGAGGIFERFFGGRRAGPLRGADLRVAVAIPLDVVLNGGEETVHVSRPQTCSVCHGLGAKAGTTPRACDACEGTGRHVTSQSREGVQVRQISSCLACHGRGTIIDQPCPDCHGLGNVDREEALTVRIPIGAEEGMVLRIPRHGMPSNEGSGPPGDLMVIVRTAPDPRFERRGADLWLMETVGVPDAALGTNLSVPTLEGPISVTVPAGTQPDTILRLRGKGLPTLGGGQRGDVFVEVQVHVPEHLSEEARGLYERLRYLQSK